MITKTKRNKWDLIKLKRLCTEKEIINQMKRQVSGLEKIMANKATDKRLISKTYKQYMQFNTRKATTQTINMQKAYTDISPKKTYR